jgi:serine/threonine protein kinase
MDTRNSAPALPPGTKLFGYEIVEKLGSGAFGIVYRATLLEIGGTVAIKEFLPAQLARRREDGHVEPLKDQVDAFQWSLEQFRKEARTLRALADPEPHPNIIKVELVFEANDTVYFSMRWEEGKPLEAILTPEQRWPEERLRTLLLALLDGLERVHDAHVLHRDIKPNNLLVRPDGSPVLIDFGAARREVAGAPQSRFIVQTPGFAPPEQAWGEYGPFTDIYALAASMFYVLLGDKPVAFGERRRWLTRELAGVYSQTFLSALDRALDPDHHQRPQNVAEWRRLFEAAATDATVVLRRGEPGTSPPSAAPAPGGEATASPTRIDSGAPVAATSRHAPRRGGIIAVLGGLALALAAAAGIWLWQPWLSAPPVADGTAVTAAADKPAGVAAAPPAQTAPTLPAGADGAPPGAPAAVAATPAAPPPTPQDAVASGTPAAAPADAAPTAPATAPATTAASAGTTATPVPAAPPALPPAKDSVAAAIRTLDCARIRLTETGEREFALAGYVGSRETLLGLRDALRRIPSIRVDIGALEILSPPVCATLQSMRRFGAEHAPSITTNHADGRYRIGDPFAVDVENRDAGSGRLHLFFVSAANEVMAFPESFAKLLYRGEKTRESGFDVGGPAGADLILAVWCRGGVELPPRLAETAGTEVFLPRLRAALDAPAAAGACSAASKVIQVAP